MEPAPFGTGCIIQKERRLARTMGLPRSRRPRVQTPRIAAIGTAVPAWRFKQEELVNLFGYGDSLRRSFFFNSGIDGRHLHMPAALPTRPETIDELSARFAEGSVRLGVQAVETCLSR